jgi:hypothetical protein
MRTASQWFQGVALTLAVLCGGLGTAVAAEDEYYELMKLFVDSFEQIDRNYVTRIPRTSTAKNSTTSTRWSSRNSEASASRSPSNRAAGI